MEINKFHRIDFYNLACQVIIESKSSDSGGSISPKTAKLSIAPFR